MVSRSTRDYQEGQVELSPARTRSQPGSVPTWGAQAPRARVQPQPPAGPCAAPGQGTQRRSAALGRELRASSLGAAKWCKVRVLRGHREKSLVMEEEGKIWELYWRNDGKPDMTAGAKMRPAKGLTECKTLINSYGITSYFHFNKGKRHTAGLNGKTLPCWGQTSSFFRPRLKVWICTCPQR